MDNCSNCELCQKKKAKLLEIAERKAKTYAIEHKRIVALYLKANGRFDFMEEKEAGEAGIKPIKFISFVQ